MDPFTIALATFGVQKLRGKSTKRALRDAAIVGGGSYAVVRRSTGFSRHLVKVLLFRSLGFGQDAAGSGISQV